MVRSGLLLSFHVLLPILRIYARARVVVVSLLGPWFADAVVVRASRPAVIDELKDEAAKRGGDAEAKADDGDKRKWMSTAQLWLDSDAKSDEVEQATLVRHAACFHQIALLFSFLIHGSFMFRVILTK
jgi:hypothetical protein